MANRASESVRNGEYASIFEWHQKNVECGSSQSGNDENLEPKDVKVEVSPLMRMQQMADQQSANRQEPPTKKIALDTDPEAIQKKHNKLNEIEMSLAQPMNPAFRMGPRPGAPFRGQQFPGPFPPHMMQMPGMGPNGFPPGMPPMGYPRMGHPGMPGMPGQGPVPRMPGMPPSSNGMPPGMMPGMPHPSGMMSGMPPDQSMMPHGMHPNHMMPGMPPSSGMMHGMPPTSGMMTHMPPSSSGHHPQMPSCSSQSMPGGYPMPQHNPMGPMSVGIPGMHTNGSHSAAPSPAMPPSASPFFGGPQSVPVTAGAASSPAFMPNMPSRPHSAAVMPPGFPQFPGPGGPPQFSPAFHGMMPTQGFPRLPFMQQQ
ncbi:hypothetical protein L596_007748 [Steinernema carpocapsae]|uniref:Uncharacterized protein n=1 Tax=Steinernema carpocapsae TaxID=34508 RepID=A0A4V6A642_STECR|nr:hypothetical protein L596_007748 [Steinernema carpocapsae]